MHKHLSYALNIRNDHPNLIEDELKKIVKNELRNNNIRSPERIQYNIDTQLDFAVTKFGMFSICDRIDRILL